MNSKGLGGNTSLLIPPDAPLTPHRFHPRARLGACPRIKIEPEAFKKMQLFVELAPQEIGWLGIATKLDRVNYCIQEVFLLRQTAGYAHAKLTEDGQMEVYNELCQAGRKKDTDLLKFWGHSHVYMPTAPSVQDNDTMIDFLKQGNDWFIRAILNKPGRASFDLYLYDAGVLIHDVPWEVWSPETGTLNIPSNNAQHSDPSADTIESLSEAFNKSTRLQRLATRAAIGAIRLVNNLSSKEASKPNTSVGTHDNGSDECEALKISPELRAQVALEIRHKVTLSYLLGTGDQDSEFDPNYYKSGWPHDAWLP